MEVPSLAERGGTKIYNYTLYTGPREYDRLARIGKERENRFELIMDFGGWFGWVAEGLLRVMKWFHGKGLSYAMAIIAITFIIKLIFWPITARSTRAMKKMAAVNAKMMPEIKDIRERYKDNYQKMNMKMMEIYKRYGVNPLSQMGGCLPMLIQLPIFFGFFTMLRTAIELRGAEFLWVADLSSPDTVAMVAGFPINIMPLLMTGTMFLQMRLQPPSPGMDPTQQAMMKYMPLMFVFFFYSASSGLCLYWTASNILGIVQTKITKIEPVENNAVEVIPPTKKKRKT
jgi:YidC/Oxa1 family membrane protein insertase